MVVDLGLVVPPDKSFPSDHNALAEFVLSEYANLPMEQKQRFQEIPKPITSDSSANTCEALTEETERALRDFMSTYNTRKDSAANTKITVVPPLHQLIDLTHYVLQFPPPTFAYGTNLTRTFGLIARHWFTISFVPLPWGHQMNQLYTLAVDALFPRLRINFSTSSYYHEFYRTWMESTRHFQNCVLPFLSPRLRFLLANHRRWEIDEMMMGFARSEPHIVRGTRAYTTMIKQMKKVLDAE